MSGVGAVAYSAFFWTYLLLSSAIYFWPALLIFVVTAPFDPKRKLLGRYTSEWAAHYLERAPFAGVRVAGRERVDVSVGNVYVVNHQSMVDVLAVFSVRLPCLWVSKAANFYAPFLGWNMLLNRFIPLRRRHLPSIMRAYRTCLARLAEGHSLLIFPEGTRSEDGELRPFFRGAFALAARSRVPVVPIVVEGTGEILGKGSAIIRPRVVSVSILDAMHPAAVDFDSFAHRDLVRGVMKTELSRIREQEGALR